MARVVLVVEKDADTREALAAILADEGYAPVPVETEDQAIAYLEAHESPCLMLLDLTVPVPTSLALLRWIADGDRGRDLRVVLISGWSNPPAELGPFRTHIAEVLRKPFDVDDALKVVARHCER